MKKYKKMLITLLLTLAVVGIGIGLPAAVSGYKDKKLDNSGETLDSLGISLETPRELESVSLVRKYAIICSGESYSAIVDSAQNMTADGVQKQVVEYLDDFKSLGLPTPDSQNAVFDADNGTIPVLFTSIYDSSEYFYAWQAVVSDETGRLVIWIDDETGAILALFYSVINQDSNNESSAGAYIDNSTINIHEVLNYFCKKFSCKLVEITEDPDGQLLRYYYVTVSFGDEYEYLKLPVQVYPGSYYEFNFDSIDGTI